MESVSQIMTALGLQPGESAKAPTGPPAEAANTFAFLLRELSSLLSADTPAGNQEIPSDLNLEIEPGADPKDLEEAYLLLASLGGLLQGKRQETTDADPEAGTHHAEVPTALSPVIGSSGLSESVPDPAGRTKPVQTSASEVLNPSGERQSETGVSLTQTESELEVPDRADRESAGKDLSQPVDPLKRGSSGKPQPSAELEGQMKQPVREIRPTNREPQGQVEQPDRGIRPSNRKPQGRDSIAETLPRPEERQENPARKADVGNPSRDSFAPPRAGAEKQPETASKEASPPQLNGRQAAGDQVSGTLDKAGKLGSSGSTFQSVQAGEEKSIPGLKASNSDQRIEKENRSPGTEGQLPEMDQLQPAASRIKTAETARSLQNAEPASIREIPRTIIKMIESGEDHLKLQLRPSSMGEVEIEISRGEQGLRISLQTESEGTVQLLKGHLDELKFALNKSGIQLQDLSVNQGKQQEAHAHHQPGRRPHSQSESDPEPEAPSQPLRYRAENSVEYLI